MVLEYYLYCTKTNDVQMRYRRERFVECCIGKVVEKAGREGRGKEPVREMVGGRAVAL